MHLQPITRLGARANESSYFTPLGALDSLKSQLGALVLVFRQPYRVRVVR